MRDVAQRVPVDIADQLRAAVETLAEQVPAVAAAVVNLSRYTIVAHWATDVPDDLSPEQTAEVTDEEWEAADERLGIALGWHIIGRLAQAIDCAEGPTLHILPE